MIIYVYYNNTLIDGLPSGKLLHSELENGDS